MSIQTSEINSQPLSQPETKVPASAEVQGHEAKVIQSPEVEDGLRRVIREVMDKHGLAPESVPEPEVDPMDQRIKHASRVVQHAELGRAPTEVKSDSKRTPQRLRPLNLYRK